MSFLSQSPWGAGRATSGRPYASAPLSSSPHIIEDPTTVEDRRALIDRLIGREAAEGRVIDCDVDFMALVELWVEGAVDMPEFRRRYQLVRGERLENRKSALIQTPPSLETLCEETDLMTEIGRVAGPEGTS